MRTHQPTKPTRLLCNTLLRAIKIMDGHIRKLMRLVSWSPVHMGGCHGNTQDKLGRIALTTPVAAGDLKDIMTDDPLR